VTCKDDQSIRLRQSKTGARVSIPVGAPLKAALDIAGKTKHGPIILTSTDKKPWTGDGFATRIVPALFHDLPM
jgi:hypothetical protein